MRPTNAWGRADDFAWAYVLERDPLTVVIVRRADGAGCSDGMSEQSHAYFAFFLRGDRLYEGCARRPRPGSD